MPPESAATHAHVLQYCKICVVTRDRLPRKVKVSESGQSQDPLPQGTVLPKFKKWHNAFSTADSKTANAHSFTMEVKEHVRHGSCGPFHVESYCDAADVGEIRRPHLLEEGSRGFSPALGWEIEFEPSSCIQVEAAAWASDLFV